MMFKLSMKLDVSLGNVLVEVAELSVAVCAYKSYSTKKTNKTNSQSHNVIRNDMKNKILLKVM